MSNYRQPSEGVDSLGQPGYLKQPVDYVIATGGITPGRRYPWLLIAGSISGRVTYTLSN